MTAEEVLLELMMEGRVVLPEGTVVELTLDIERKVDPEDHDWNYLDPHSEAPWSGMDQGRVKITPAMKIVRP